MASRTSVCVCVSGSVAAVKAPDLADAFTQRGMDVDMVITKAAFSLLQSTYRGSQPWARLQSMAASTSQEATSEQQPASGSAGVLRLWRDEDEWNAYLCGGHGTLKTAYALCASVSASGRSGAGTLIH